MLRAKSSKIQLQYRIDKASLLGASGLTSQYSNDLLLHAFDPAGSGLDSTGRLARSLAIIPRIALATLGSQVNKRAI